MIDFKNLGIGAAAGAGVTALALNTPKLAKRASEKFKEVKLNRSLNKRKKKDQESANATPETE